VKLDGEKKKWRSAGCKRAILWMIDGAEKERSWRTPPSQNWSRSQGALDLEPRRNGGEGEQKL
jgi:hypothetical protein